MFLDNAAAYRLKVPQPWPDRQDEAQKEEFQKKLQGLIEDPNVDLWYGDETGIEGEPKPRRSWAIKGSTPREASHCDADVFQVFLDEAAKSIAPTRKRNILILDNASWHKRKSLNWHFFEPLYLPPYSSDFNPIERIWLIMKAEHFTNIHCRNKAALIERADYALCDLMDNPQKVASAAGSIRNEL